MSLLHNSILQRKAGLCAKNIAPDLVKAEQKIRSALEQRNLRDRADVIDRAIEIYTALGNNEQAAKLKEELKILTAPPKKTTNTPITVTKIGRNEPCPCGSGKKYKKCCGK